MQNATRLAVLIWFTALLSNAATFEENFARDPIQGGWRLFGDPTAFRWNASNQVIEVTWDSSRTNSYFYRQLGTILGKEDDFQLAFDLRLNDVQTGTDPSKPFTFEIAVGFINLGNATDPNFFRGTGTRATNLVEFNYFPDSGFGATVWPTFISTNGALNYNGSGDYTLFELTTGDWFRVSMIYIGATRRLTTSLAKNGGPAVQMNEVQLTQSFSDYRVNAIAISSYNHYGADGSILARGTVDNLILTVPEPPIRNLEGHFTNRIWEVSFSSASNWLYMLERTTNFVSWIPSSLRRGGNGLTLFLVGSPGTELEFAL